MVAARRDLIRWFGKVNKVQEFGPIAQAFEVYAEACAYLVLKAKGIALERTPGTGKDKQKRPDFIYTTSGGSIYFEVKCLDVEGGTRRHAELADRALDVAVKLDLKRRKPGVHFGELEISPFEPGSKPSDRIEKVIQKIRSNLKRDQIRYGPTILVVDLGRLELVAQHPSSLLPVYFNEGMPSITCASGELWHVAFGRKGDMIYQLPEFEGKTNLDRPLEEEGVLREFPELLGVSFILHRLAGLKEIFSLRTLSPETALLKNPLTLDEFKVGEVVRAYSDAFNDDYNTYQSNYVRSK